MPYKLSDQTQGFLDRNTAHKAHRVGVVALGNQLHHMIEEKQDNYASNGKNNSWYK